MKVHFLQHYYTASRKIGDYNTLGKSKEISKEEDNELLRYIDYARAVGLPYKPDNSEIQRFPTAYSYYILKSGKKCFTTATYTGRGNHTPSRWNNFFSHTLLLIPNIEIRVTNIFKQAPFIKGMSPEEDVQVPDDLDSLEIEIKDLFFEYFNELTIFLKQNNRLVIFQALLNTLIANFKKNAVKKILILDDKDNLANWFFATHFFLPYAIASQITFTSYKGNASSSKLYMTGIIPECEYVYSDEDNFYFFDIKNKNYPTSFQQTLYTTRIEEIIIKNDYEKLQEMYQIAEDFEIREIGELDIIFQYDNFTQPENIKNCTPDRFIAFANKVSVPTYREKLFDKAAAYNPALVHEYAKNELTKRVGSGTACDFGKIYKDYYQKYLYKDIKTYTNSAIFHFLSLYPQNRNGISNYIIQIIENNVVSLENIEKALAKELCEDAANLLSEKNEYVSEKNVYERIRKIADKKNVTIQNKAFIAYEFVEQIDKKHNSEEKIIFFCEFLLNRNNLTISSIAISKALDNICMEWKMESWDKIIEAMCYNMQKDIFAEFSYNFIEQYKQKLHKEHVLQTLICGLLNNYSPKSSSTQQSLFCEELIKKFLNDVKYRNMIGEKFKEGMLRERVNNKYTLDDYNQWYNDSNSTYEKAIKNVTIVIEDVKKKTITFLTKRNSKETAEKVKQVSTSKKERTIWNRENWQKHIEKNKYKDIDKIINDYKEVKTYPSKEWVIKMLITVLVDKIEEKESYDWIEKILKIKKYRSWLGDDFFNVILCSIVHDKEKLYKYAEIYNDLIKWYLNEGKLNMKFDSSQ